MGSGFQTPITIKNAIDKIYQREFLIPAIQRKFVWKSYQIEMLFDSILRGYPINSFMFWKISDSQIKSGFKFYGFLPEFRERYSENNKDINTVGVKDFFAIIDGQQRLTSLYIGLRGSYAYKLPRKWWANDEESLPTRHLYLNLSKPVDQQYDNQKMYDFRFLSENDLAKLKNTGEFWFKVGDILVLDKSSKVFAYLSEKNLNTCPYAVDTLSNLYDVIHNQGLINYYLQEEQDADKVLDIFIRTNSGGTSLSFSDLLMSMAAANWEKIDARKEMNSVVEQVLNIKNGNFSISKDFVLKTCLFLLADNIRFKLDNFSYRNVKLFEDNWKKIKDSIIATFNLLAKLGFNDATFRAKNAAIPVIYYVFNKNLSSSIVKATYDKEDKNNITNWLILSFLKSVFGGQTDSILMTIRKVLKESSFDKFPSKDLMDAFKDDAARNYSFDDEFLDRLLESQKDSTDALYVLHLLYPNLDFFNQSIHQDHLHPASIFKDQKRLSESIPNNDLDYAKDEKHWNSVLNLQLLNDSLNESKSDKPLAEWVQENNIDNASLLVPSGTSLDIKDFRSFIEKRRKFIKDYLKNLARK